jgi:hypothetical protein
MEGIGNLCLALDVRNSLIHARGLHYRQSIPDTARESRIAVGGASAVVDVTQALEFCKGQ